MIKLLHGDCQTLIKTIPFDFCIVTDPPFNVGYHYHSYVDRLVEAAYYNWLAGIFGNNPFVVVHYPENLYKLFYTIDKFPDKIISWVYNSNLSRQHRDIAFCGIKPDMNKLIQPYKNPKDKRIMQNIANGKVGCKSYDWWEINQVKNVSKDKTEHPCQMPLKVMENIITLLPEKTVIVDPFMGSGTTGVACRNLGYDFIGIEQDDIYFKIAENRINSKEVV